MVSRQRNRPRFRRFRRLAFSTLPKRTCAKAIGSEIFRRSLFVYYIKQFEFVASSLLVMCTLYLNEKTLSHC
jgi:hypothetical protein